MQASAEGTVDALLQEAEAAYGRGERALAQRKLEQVLAAQKRHPRAHWLLGNVYQDENKLDQAISSYRRALRADASLAEARNDLGTAYHAKGWYAEAEQCYREVIEQASGHLAAAENLAAALRAQGKLREARDAYLNVLTLRVSGWLLKLAPWRRAGQAVASHATRPHPDQSHAEARKKIARSDHRAAAQLLRRSLADRPEDAEAHHLLGSCLVSLGDSAEGLAHLEKAVELRSSVPEFHLALGNILAEQRDYGRALKCYQFALLLDPGFAPAVANTAKVLHDLGHHREAEKGFRDSLAVDPEMAAVHANLAGVLISLGKYADAEAAARRALRMEPESVHALVALSRGLMEQGRHEEAWALAEQARARAPDDANVLRFLAELAMIAHGDLAQAERYIKSAVAIAPQNASAQLTYAHVLLHQRRFVEGWERYEWRKKLAEREWLYTLIPLPEWDGTLLHGRGLLINAEQGLGDEIMFASCFEEAAARVGRCAVYCSRRLERLFKRSFLGIEIVPGSHISPTDRFPALTGFDFQIAAGSLPRLFRRSEAEFPGAANYLKADANRIRSWRTKIDALGAGVKVGLSWRGGTPLTGHTRRTLTLDALADILRIKGISWVSIQYGEGSQEVADARARFGMEITHWQEALDDLDETAALLGALDLRISVCSTQVHLSGAQGLEAWVLAPIGPDSRYGHEGERMPWYPSIRVFRQKAAGDWTAPLAELEAALRERVRLATPRA